VAGLLSALYRSNGHENEGSKQQHKSPDRHHPKPLVLTQSVINNSLSNLTVRLNFFWRRSARRVQHLLFE
jgi:hypothetical protein